MSVSYQELTIKHPCFSRGKHLHKGRIHLPVSPGCNIACKFCDRKMNDFEQRPGVSSTVLTPEEAVDVVRKSVELCPEITVVGIAGPGDTLATSNALDTFRLIKKEFPELLKCMSTNGLLLYEKADELIEVGIDSLTVTVNAVNPSIQAQICSRIVYHGKVYTGEEAAAILIRNQLEGIEKIAGAGIAIKVNTVYIPGINDGHIEEVAKAVKETGAKLYNIIPLIPQHELSYCAAPSCMEIDSARQQAEKHLHVFRHCQRCRADAVGFLGGEDFSAQVYERKVPQENTFSHG